MAMNERPPWSSERTTFEAERREKARRMAADASLQARMRELIGHADRYDNVYQWNWLGVPIIQQAEDIVVMQEIIWRNRPDIIVETGVAWGGSAVLSASVLQLIGRGKVIAIDIDIRPHNRAALAAHPLSRRIELIKGSSTDKRVIDEVRTRIPAGAAVMVNLDSDHTRDHVLAELRVYGPMVSEGQVLVVSDTRISDASLPEHRARRWHAGNDPKAALDIYLAETDRFVRDEEINSKLLMTASPGGYLRCVRP